ncbi:hypothetical protein PINS_up023575 [Pythium insidiosum]|nr:hypothetical protein PINS_up023575 [Pythium insidiosum]
MGMLSRVKTPELISETLQTLLTLVTPPPPAAPAVDGAATETEAPAPVVIHADDNAQFILETGCQETSAWKGGAPIVAVWSAAVSPEIKLQAVRLFSHLFAFASSRAKQDSAFLACVRAFQIEGSPCTSLLACLDVSEREDLELSSLRAISLLLDDPPDTSFLSTFYEAQGLNRVLRVATKTERHFHEPMLQVVETFSRYGAFLL